MLIFADSLIRAEQGFAQCPAAVDGSLRLDFRDLVDGCRHPAGAILRDPCRGLLVGLEVPKAIELRETPLSRSAAGKILKRELRAPPWQGREKMIS